MAIDSDVARSLYNTLHHLALWLRGIYLFPFVSVLHRQGIITKVKWRFFGTICRSEYE